MITFASLDVDDQWQFPLLFSGEGCSAILRRGEPRVRRVLAIRAPDCSRATGASVMSTALVLIDAGRVVDVDDTGADPSPGAEVVDLGDVTLLPGLVDAHVHRCFDAGDDVLAPLRHDDDATLLERMVSNAEPPSPPASPRLVTGRRGYLGPTGARL